MQWFGATYTKRFNLRHNRSGHLFQGRFKNMLVQDDAYLLQLSYYIHRNPLRAGMVKRIADYKWSSYRAYAYGKRHQSWLNTNVILSQFVNVKDQHQAYRENIQKYSKEEQRVWEDLRHGLFVGTERVGVGNSPPNSARAVFLSRPPGNRCLYPETGREKLCGFTLMPCKLESSLVRWLSANTMYEKYHALDIGLNLVL